MFEKAIFIVNPRSSGGLDRKRLTQIEVAIKGAFPHAELRRTTGPRAAVELAAQARREGTNLLGVVGGDGTVNEVVNGLLAEPVADGVALPALGIIPTGTGCDFVKSIDVPKDLDGALAVIGQARVRACDAVRITCRRRDDGSEMVYYFINMGGFGASGQVVDKVNRSSKKLGGFVSFASATVSTLMSYRGCHARYRVDGGEWIKGHFNTLFIANGQYQGGGMRTGNGAYLDDGEFKVLAVEQTGALTLMSKIGKLYSGDLDSDPVVTVNYGTRVEAEPEGNEEILVECDGEQPGRLPATYELVPAVVPSASALGPSP